MTQTIHELVSVESSFDHKKLIFTPRSVIWNGRSYTITKIGLHHTYVKGDILYHVFSVTTPTLFMRLLFNTKNLNWNLEEITGKFV